MANIMRRGESGSLPRSGGLDPFELMSDLMGWDPFRELVRSRAGGETFAPSFDVKETGDAYLFRADLPGLKESDVDISLTGNRLIVSGRREEEAKREDERYFVYERSHGTFSRSFTLPEGVDADHVQAEMKDGVLTLVVPKKPEVQPKRISVRSAGSAKTSKA
jgi:HSP20 family protein